MSNAVLHIAQQTFTSEVLKSLDVSSFPAYEALVLSYAKGWLSGQQYFEFHTSGSTGEPKSITHSRAAIIASIEATAQALELNAGDTALLCLNAEMMGGRMMLYRALHLNMKLTVVSPSGNPFSSGAGAYDFLSFVPLQLQQLLTDPQQLSRLNKAKAIILGGTAVPPSLIAALSSIMAPVYSTYGMTETISHIALQRLNGAEKETRYHVMPGIEVSLDERGCLCIKGAVTYHETIVTNDLALLIDQQHFIITGRVDQIINSGGIKINPATLEAAIQHTLQQQGIQEYFLTGVPDESLGQKLVLFVKATNMDTASLLEALKKVLPIAYHVPKQIIILENFPYTASGKVDRLKMVSQYLNPHHA